MARLIGDKAMNRLISHEQGVMHSVDNEARLIAGTAEALLSHHRKTGETHIETALGGVDAEVSLVGEGAMSIEFGHFHNFSHKYIIGLYILSAAAGLLD